MEYERKKLFEIIAYTEPVLTNTVDEYAMMNTLVTSIFFVFIIHGNKNIKEKLGG